MLQLPADAERPVLLRYDPSLDPILRLGLYGERRPGPPAADRRGAGQARARAHRGRRRGRGQRRSRGGDPGRARRAPAGQPRPDRRTRCSTGWPQENVNLTGGRLREGQTEYLVRTINEFLRPEDLEQVVIDSSPGAIVRLADVARVRQGPQGARDHHPHRRPRERRGRRLQGGRHQHGHRLGRGAAPASTTLRERLQQVDPALELDGDHRPGALHPPVGLRGAAAPRSTAACWRSWCCSSSCAAGRRR